MVQVSAASIAAWTRPPDGALLISASPGPMAAEHESLRLNAALMRLGLSDWLPGFREFGVSEGEIGGGTGANDFGTDPAFAFAAPGTGTIPAGECIHVNCWQLAAFAVTRRYS